METSLGRRLAQAYAPPDGPGRIRAIEGARGFAALLVFFVHFNAIFGGYAAPDSTGGAFFQFASTLGRSGVNLLFVISGYLIYGGLLRKPSGYGRFVFHRLKRIYPAFFCVFAGYLALRLTVFTAPNPAIGGVYVLQNLALLPGLLAIKPLITVAWSLSYQAFFYCAIPLLVGLAGMRRWTSAARCYFFLGLAGLYSILNLQCPNLFISWLGFYPAAHPRMLMFIAGILVYEVQSLGLPGNAVRRVTPLVAPAGLAAYYLLQTNPWMLAHLRTAICSAAVLGAAYFCFVLDCFAFPGPLAKAFSWAPLRFVGTISYSYYLIHGPTLHGLRLVAPQGASPVLLLPAAIGLTLVTSSLLFLLVEKPLSFGRRQ
jgi:peptidoglycan/LPS O-acetylase OafA/YrhL